MAKRVLCKVPFRLVSQVNVDNFMSDAFGPKDQTGPVRIGAEPHAVDADQALWDWPRGEAPFPQGPGGIVSHVLPMFAQWPALTAAAMWLAAATAASKDNGTLVPSPCSCSKFNLGATGP